MKITRRKFIRSSIMGALGLALGIDAVASAPKKAPAALGRNPLFSGALGKYEGVTVYEPTEHEAAIVEAYMKGSGAVMYKGRGAKWIPINKLYRQG